MNVAHFSQYYETSTFHHLSSWRLRYQQCDRFDVDFVQFLTLLRMTADILQGKRRRLAENQAAEADDDALLDDDQHSPPAAQALGPVVPMLEGVPAQTVVFHVDLDCFYVSVAVRDNPSLAGKPVAVCPASRFNGTSEIASASYEARAFGVKSRMRTNPPE